MKIFFSKKNFKIQNKMNYDQDSYKEILFLKIDFNGSIGYSSYSAWEEFGQLNIKDVLDQKLVNNFNLLNNLILRAWRDAFFYQKYNDCAYLKPFKNHSFFFNGKIIQTGSRKVKVKLQGDFETDLRLIKELSESFDHLRLDGNFRYTKESYKELYNFISKNKSVEYLEDPFKFNREDYEKYLNKLAIDHPFNNKEIHHKLCEYFIIKPNLRTSFSQLNTQFVFSNNMGHSLSAWHDYCDLISFGDLGQTHGVYLNDFLEEDFNIFDIKENMVFINDKVFDVYESLKVLEWTSIN